jgi:hypothetical protein
MFFLLIPTLLFVDFLNNMYGSLLGSPLDKTSSKACFSCLPSPLPPPYAVGGESHVISQPGARQVALGSE